MPETKSILYNNAEIFYEVHGNGKPVILLHGFAETGSVWFNQTNYLKNTFKVIVPDLPGYGKSTKLNIETAKVKIDDYADCIYALLNEENIKSCTILGHSMGGYITLSFSAKHPELLNAFGFVHSTAFTDSEEKKQNRLHGIQMIENYGCYAFVKSTTPNLFTQKFKDENVAAINKLVEQGKSFNKKALQQSYYAMMNRNDSTALLKNSKIPVLFIAGNQDTVVPVNDVLKQVHIPEIAYFHLLNNVSHMGMWEAAQKVNEYVEDFINDVA